MKNNALLLLTTIVLFSCSQKRIKNAVSTITSISDGDRVYTDTEFIPKPGDEVVAEMGKYRIINGFMNSCVIHKTYTGSYLTFVQTPSQGFPLALSIVEAVGPANAVGVYRLTDDSERKLNTFIETATDKIYAVDSMIVNITQASGDIVAGNFKIWVSDQTTHKDISGNISCYGAGTLTTTMP